MGSRIAGDVPRQLERAFNGGTVAGLSEGKLLDRFASGRDEAAFAALVALHGPMVLGVCRRALRNEHDVEDAFQATFLVLVRRAGAIRDGDLMGHWLYGVAHRVAVRARANAARRHVHERTGVSAERGAPAACSDDSDRRELSQLLDEELVRLPDSLRKPLVLCYLDGMSHDEAADRLGWPVGTVRSRMARARGVLRNRLARRGVVATGAGLSATLAPQPVPAALVNLTVRNALAFSTRPATATAVASASAAALAKGVLNAMTISKIKIVGAATLACVLAIGGAQSLALQHAGQGAAATAASDPNDRLTQSVTKIQSDLIDAARRNLELQKEVQELKSELETLRTAPAGRSGGAGESAYGKLSAGVAGRSSRIGSTGAAPAGVVGFPAGGAGISGMDGAPAGGFAGGFGGGAGEASGGFPAVVGGGAGGGGPTGGFGGGEGAGGMAGFAGGPGAFGGGPRAFGSMGGGAGTQRPRGRNAGTPNGVHYLQAGKLIVLSSPEGDKITAYSTDTGKAKSLTVAEAKDQKCEVVPIATVGLVALQITGPKVTRIAAFSSSDGTWHSQDLREPVREAIPVVGQNMVVYTLGRRLYAFSSVSGRWDVIDLPEGAKPQPSVGAYAITCQHEAHLYVFSANTGEWLDLDSRALGDSPEKKGSAAEK